MGIRGDSIVGVADGAPAAEQPPRHLTSRRRTGGQSLVEFALTLPVVLLMILFGLDFGRVFLGWITLNNAVREAANFAALNPTGWSGGGNAAVQAEYLRLINAESTRINCTLPNPLPSPTFPIGTDVGSPAVVQITCRFSLITPIIGGIVGNNVAVTSTAAFPIRSGVIEGIPIATSLPTALPSLGPSVAPSVAPSTSPSPSPIPACTVPNLVGKKANQGTINSWTQAGFGANALIFNPAPGNPAYTIGTQSLGAGTSVVCSSGMTVTP